MKGDAQGLLAVATSIADGQDVDWQEAESGLRTDHERALLRAMRVIASIGEVHRSTEDPDDDDDQSALLLARRGRIVGRIAPSRSSSTSFTPGTPSASTGSPSSSSPSSSTASPAASSALPISSASAGRSSSDAPSGTGNPTPPSGGPDASSVAETVLAAPTAAPAGALETWGSLILRERVGAGVFGEVYRAYDEQLDREVALKLLRIGSRSADRLAAKVLHEGRLLARVRHPNVVLVHGVEARGDRVGLWMEFIRGCTLEQLLERQGLFGAREAALIGQDLCRALAAVHAAGLVHRDVKAQNVMREEGGRVVLMDFGAGVPMREEDGASNAPAAGTPLYLAPELLNGDEATAASDLYSLGVLLYHLVTGTYPVTATSLAGLREAHQRGRRRLQDVRPDLPDAFVQAVDRALAPNPAERHASAGAMQDALTRTLGVDLEAPPASNAPEIRTLLPAGANDRPATTTARGAVAPAQTSAFGRLRRWLLIGGVLALAAAAAALFLQSYWRTPAPGPIQAVVVLPLANVSSGDKDLAEGINVLIAEQLSTLPTLRVVHYTASMASRDQGLPVSEIIRRAQTDAAISGSVDWTGSRAHVYMQIVRAGASNPTWVKQFEVQARRAAELPRMVARDVAAALGLPLSPSDELVLEGPGANTPEAFEAYLRARVNMRIATVPAVKQAIEQLQDALRLDPAHAPSLAALANCYIVQAASHSVRPFAEAGALAREAAERALQIDSQLADAYQALADVKFYIDWDWAGAEQAFKRAIEYRPNSGDLRSRYAMFLASRKRLPDAIQEVHQAVALDPMSPLANATLGMLWHYARSDDQAERIWQGVLEGDANYYPARIGLVRTYLRTRRYDLALKELERLRANAGGQWMAGQLSMVGIAYAGLGRVAEATEIAERLVAQDGTAPSVDAAGVLTALNQRERALDILERAVESKAPKVLFLRLDPRFDALLNEPRFRGLLRRMGFSS